MTLPRLSLVAGAILLAVLLVTQRWTLVAAPNGVYRLDRWTGEVRICSLSATTTFPNPNFPAGVILSCDGR